MAGFSGMLAGSGCGFLGRLFFRTKGNGDLGGVWGDSCLWGGTRGQPREEMVSIREAPGNPTRPSYLQRLESEGSQRRVESQVHTAVRLVDRPGPPPGNFLRLGILQPSSLKDT